MGKKNDKKKLKKPVKFKCKNLKRAVRKALRKPKGSTITRKKMASLEKLETKNKEITDLTGLEHATNLT